MVELISVSLAAAEVAGGGFNGNVIGVTGAVIAAGIIVFGAAIGISRIASSATEAIARQPEAGGRIFTSMLLASAFIEGGMLLALIVCIFAILRLA
jgi:F-type H+-transporting ATPase subunit c